MSASRFQKDFSDDYCPKLQGRHCGGAHCADVRRCCVSYGLDAGGEQAVVRPEYTAASTPISAIPQQPSVGDLANIGRGNLPNIASADVLVGNSPTGAVLKDTQPDAESGVLNRVAQATKYKVVDGKAYKLEIPVEMRSVIVDDPPSLSAQGRTVFFAARPIALAVIADSDLVESRRHTDFTKKPFFNIPGFEAYERWLLRSNSVGLSRENTCRTKVRRWNAVQRTVEGRDKYNDEFFLQTVGVPVGGDVFLFMLFISPPSPQQLDLGQQWFHHIKETATFWTENNEFPQTLAFEESMAEPCR